MPAKVEYVAVKQTSRFSMTAQVRVNGKYFADIYPNSLSSHYTDPGKHIPFVGLTMADPNKTNGAISLDVMEGDLSRVVQCLADMQERAEAGLRVVQHLADMRPQF